MGNIYIKNKYVGYDYPPYVICEISANHNGDLQRALKLITAAAKTGCDAVKIQTYTPDTMTIDHDSDDFLIRGGIWDGYKLYDLYKEAHTPYEWHKDLFAHARSLGVELISTPYDNSAIDLLEQFNVPAYKIASFELTDLPLIRYAAQKGKPLIISTGMGNIEEIKAAVETAKSVGNDQIILLHCISSYPAPVDSSNLKTIEHLAKEFNVLPGLSDHTLSNATSIASVALGASVIEKHFTLKRSDGGPDSSFSLEPDEFSNLVKDCKDAWAALGRVNYDLKDAEKTNIKYRRSIYFVTALKAGDVIKKSDVKIVRPGFGLQPAELENIIGRKVKTDIQRGLAVSWNHIE
ncbi:pseudaminic acid synthase [Paracoccaceae bacterium]|nr:pseudaminic acid synthase [Paracoccaceae bacterium]